MRILQRTLLYCGLSLILISCGTGWDVGNGGNGFAAEFLDIGRTVVRRWKAMPEKKFVLEGRGEVSLEDFERTLETAKLRTTDEELEIDGYGVDAINYPDKRLIVLSLTRWSKSLRFSEKRMLVIHEILSLLRVEPSLRYDFTSYMVSSLDFYRGVPIYYFMVDGVRAKALVERVRWQPEDMKVTTLYSRKTFYDLPVLPGAQDKLSCIKTETTNDGVVAPDIEPSYQCYITCFYAVLSDDSSIQVTLDSGGVFHQRLFGDKKAFDDRLLKGEVGFNPVFFIYLDR